MNTSPAASGSARLAVATMMKNEESYLLEWLAFHDLQGVDLFRIYDNESTDDTAGLLSRIPLRIEVVQWTRPSRMRQKMAFDDALANLRGRADWIAFIDVDEFLFDPTFRPLPDVLDAVNRNISSVAVNQRVFGSSGHLTMTPEPVTQRFCQRARDDHPEHRWTKSIVRSSATISYGEYAEPFRLGYRVLGDGLPFQPASTYPGEADRVATGGLRLHHYMLKSLEEFRTKQERGDASDNPATGYKRFGDGYFIHREKFANAVRDETLRAAADRLRRRMEELLGTVTV